VERPAWLTSAKLRELQHDAPVTPRLEVCDGIAQVGLDLVGSTPHPGAGASLAIPRTRRVELSGWALSAADKQPGTDVEIDIDGAVTPAFYGFDRPDVAAAFGTPGAEPSGFLAMIPANLLSVGPHVVKLRLVAADNRCFYEVPLATLLAH
jgi:hypothetical protein